MHWRTCVIVKQMQSNQFWRAIQSTSPTMALPQSYLWNLQLLTAMFTSFHVTLYPIFPTLPCGEILRAHRNCIDLFMCDTFSEILLVICWGYDPQQASPKLNREQFLFIRCLILIHILWWIFLTCVRNTHHNLFVACEWLLESEKADTVWKVFQTKTNMVSQFVWFHQGARELFQCKIVS